MHALRYLAITAATASLAVVVAHPAAAAGNVLTLGSTSGTAVAVGDILKGSLTTGSKATFFTEKTGTTGVSCNTSTLTAKVTANPLAPGTATESLTGQTFTNCTSNQPGVTGVNTITVTNLPYVAKVTSPKSFTLGSVTGKISASVSLSTFVGNITCVYNATTNPLKGTSNNANNSVNLLNQGFTKGSGSDLCPSGVFLTAHYGPITDTSKANQKVYVH